MFHDFQVIRPEVFLERLEQPVQVTPWGTQRLQLLANFIAAAGLKGFQAVFDPVANGSRPDRVEISVKFAQEFFASGILFIIGNVAVVEFQHENLRDGRNTLIALFYLLFLGSPELPGQSSVFPPNGSVVLQRGRQVRLRWKLPGKSFLVRLYEEGRLRGGGDTAEQTMSVAVNPGCRYLWTVLPKGQKLPSTFSFAVSGTFSYHADGSDGADGYRGRGLPGTSGRALKLELWSDSEQQVHLVVEDRPKQTHFVFCEPGLKLLVSSRGGNGGRGANAHPWNWDGYDGGAAGWGGDVTITTRNCPWRYFVDLDLAPGRPGEGGSPNSFEDDTGDPGDPGRSGQPGVVRTRIDSQPRD